MSESLNRPTIITIIIKPLQTRTVTRGRLRRWATLGNVGQCWAMLGNVVQCCAYVRTELVDLATDKVTRRMRWSRMMTVAKETQALDLSARECRALLRVLFLRLVLFCLASCVNMLPRSPGSFTVLRMSFVPNEVVEWEMHRRWIEHKCSACLQCRQAQRQLFVAGTESFGT